MSGYAGFDDYIRNENLETEEGKWVEFGPDVGIKILRAGGSNEKFARTFTRVTRPVKRQMESGKLSYKENLRLHAKIYAESIVIDWRGIRDKDTGEEIPFSKQNVEEFLIAMPEVFTVIREYAEDMETFRTQQIEEEVQQLGN